MFSLQIAPEQRDVASRLELAPYRRVQRFVELAETQRLLRICRLRLVVEKPLRDRVGHQLVERDPLQRENLLIDRDIGRRYGRPDLDAVGDVEVADARAAQ